MTQPYSVYLELVSAQHGIQSNHLKALILVIPSTGLVSGKRLEVCNHAGQATVLHLLHGFYKQLFYEEYNFHNEVNQ